MTKRVTLLALVYLTPSSGKCISAFVKYLLFVVPFLAGCLYVNVPTGKNENPGHMTNPPSAIMPRTAAPVTRGNPVSVKLIVSYVRVNLANREVREENGQPSGRWEAVKQYLVSLRPIDNENIRGANRGGEILIISTTEDFYEGQQLVLSTP